MHISPLLVLRFRDVNVNIGETIAKHQTLIADHGYCWWGLFPKDDEANPYQRLAALHQELIGKRPDGTYPVMLYDTGTKSVYEAACEDVRVSKHKVYSPEIDLTPAYYRDKQEWNWFRFRAISLSSSAALCGRTCAEMPSASTNSFTDLLNKKVSDLRDLRRQEVTLWVLE